LDHIPNGIYIREKDLDMGIQMALREMSKSDLLIFVAPKQVELAGLLALIDMINLANLDIPMVFVNPQFVQSWEMLTGEPMKRYRVLERSLEPTFFLNQIEPEDDGDEVMLNAAVVSRVWPRPYSTWEDNPEDPESVDGYFLMHSSNIAPLPREKIVKMLEASRYAREMMEAAQPPS